MMNSGYHNRNKKDRRDSPSSSSRPRSSSKTSAAVNNEANQRNRTPPKSINGKMPSVANSPSTEALSNEMANMVLKKISYPVGSKITAKLNTGSEMKGEIVAYDSEYKVVIMRTPGSRPGHHNVSILNLVNCAEIKVDEECKESPGGMPEMSMQKLEDRRRTETEKKMKLITAFKAGISPEGQKLFRYINRTLDEVTWHNDKILVMNKVLIEPPYRPEHVRIKQGIKEDDSTMKNLSHIRKIVERFSESENSKSIASTTPSVSVTGGSTAYSDSAASVNASPVTAASVVSRTSGSGPSGGGSSSLTSNTSGSASGLTTTIPNLPQAPAVPQSSSASSSHSKQPPGGGGSNSGGGSRSNRNNAGRKQHVGFMEINNNYGRKKGLNSTFGDLYST